MSDAEKHPDPEERRQLRPYRRGVGGIFTIVLVVCSILVLRGIIRHLDRLPSVDALYKTPNVDVRALRACAEDLDKLEAKVRSHAGKAFSDLPEDDAPVPSWQALGGELEHERLTIVARCRLHEPSEDAVVKDLEEAANHIEVLIRSYALLYARHATDGVPESREARRVLKRARSALKSR
jgi:hypothetical protein